MAGKKRAKASLEFRNTPLADALQTQDMAALAFALRHGPTVVPLMRPGQRDDPRDGGEFFGCDDRARGIGRAGQHQPIGRGIERGQRRGGHLITLGRPACQLHGFKV